MFEQIKVNQRDPVTNKRIANKNKAAKTSKQTIIEEHDNKKHLLMISYHTGKWEQVVKSVIKTVKKILSSNTKLQVSFADNNFSSRFNIKSKTKCERKHVIYLRRRPRTMCNDNYIIEAKRQTSRMLNGHNDRYIRSQFLKHVLENDHKHVSEKDFK